jgi:hypothetical protein
LNGEIFYSLREAQILIEEWRKHYNNNSETGLHGFFLHRRNKAHKRVARNSSDPMQMEQ